MGLFVCSVSWTARHNYWRETTYEEGTPYQHMEALDGSASSSVTDEETDMNRRML
jgi:hypothetical protein